jgi:hypothetical protein
MEIGVVKKRNLRKGAKKKIASLLNIFVRF